MASRAIDEFNPTLRYPRSASKVPPHSDSGTEGGGLRISLTAARGPVKRAVHPEPTRPARLPERSALAKLAAGAFGRDSP
jgi:hypothetical protein